MKSNKTALLFQVVQHVFNGRVFWLFRVARPDQIGVPNSAFCLSKTAAQFPQKASYDSDGELFGLNVSKIKKMPNCWWFTHIHMDKRETILYITFFF